MKAYRVVQLLHSSGSWLMRSIAMLSAFRPPRIYRVSGRRVNEPHVREVRTAGGTEDARGSPPRSFVLVWISSQSNMHPMLSVSHFPSSLSIFIQAYTHNERTTSICWQVAPWYVLFTCAHSGCGFDADLLFVDVRQEDIEKVCLSFFSLFPIFSCSPTHAPPVT